ncbi:ATP cone domain protein [Phycisphaerae bacterium RAS1]|nr:ATP cone domain protein [Phycisphaerae bacterium RAS1]
MNKPSPLIVTKRDGTVEAFSLAKLRCSIATVMENASYDPRLGGPLSKAVAAHLQELPEGRPPSTDYVYRCVQSVLRQTGLSDVAELLDNHRRQRRARRQRLIVLDPAHTGRGRSRWRKEALVARLRRDHDLGSAAARFIAGRVEARVFELNAQQLEAAALTDVLARELAAWGLGEDPVSATPAASGGQAASIAGPASRKEE